MLTAALTHAVVALLGAVLGWYTRRAWLRALVGWDAMTSAEAREGVQAREDGGGPAIDMRVRPSGFGVNARVPVVPPAGRRVILAEARRTALAVADDADARWRRAVETQYPGAEDDALAEFEKEEHHG